MAVLLALLLSLTTLSVSHAESAKPIELKIVGGLGGLKLFTQFESPFWTETITKMSEGRIKATIHPFDKSGLRGEEMLQLIQMGVVPFGTALLGLVAGDEPELNGIYLGNLGTSGKSLRSTVEQYRNHITTLLRERYGIELLAIYAYAEQVVFCTKAFSGLEDLAGRRIRTSHVGQSDLISELGATPVVLPFRETLRAIQRGDIDCAITGTSGGNESDLFKMTTHISEMGLTPGLSIFAVNSMAWAALPEDIRTTIRTGIKDLEERIWTASEQDTENGLACNIGRSDCVNGKPGKMILVQEKEADRVLLRKLLATRLLPDWVERCGISCADAWNALMAENTGLVAGYPIPTTEQRAKTNAIPLSRINTRSTAKP